MSSKTNITQSYLPIVQVSEGKLPFVNFADPARSETYVFPVISPLQLGIFLKDVLVEADDLDPADRKYYFDSPDRSNAESLVFTKQEANHIYDGYLNQQDTIRAYISLNKESQIFSHVTGSRRDFFKIEEYGFIAEIKLISDSKPNRTEFVELLTNPKLKNELLENKNYSLSLRSVAEANIKRDYISREEKRFFALTDPSESVEEVHSLRQASANVVDAKAEIEQLAQTLIELVHAHNGLSSAAGLVSLSSEHERVTYHNIIQDYREGHIDVLTFAQKILNEAKVEGRWLQRYLSLDTVLDRLIEAVSFFRFSATSETIENQINEKVRENMEKHQRSYFHSEMIKAIKQSMNNGEEDDDSEELLKRIEGLNVKAEIKEKLRGEVKRLDMMPTSSPEHYIQRNYLDWVLNLPYHGDKLDQIDIAKSREILDSDHYGLTEAKDRVLEYLAVLARVGNSKSPIICLIGPPGVGKTSLGKSIAKATGRKYTRFALGGVSDEAEIRGHRRTYVGSQPGKIIQHLSKVKTNNPLFLLDEIDKIANTSGTRGDPASALLEVLDPEQNSTFSDNYLDIEYDLSNVLFVATANSYNIPPALLDRMDIIDVGSYTVNEKFEIAKRHILPRLLRRNGLDPKEVDFPDSVINFIIDGYTNEAGVRSLERRMERMIRYAIKEIVEGKTETIHISNELVEKVLGPVVNDFDLNARKTATVGLMTGLAWTNSGGAILPIESAVTKGKGLVSSTGSLGDNIKESISAAITLIRQRSAEFGLEEDFYLKNDFHVHFPNAAIKKDGPSAGAAITTCLISTLTKKPISQEIGMTGEISLLGKVMKIGGVKEKVISAHRNGVRTIILPKTNEADLFEVPLEIKADLTFYPVDNIDQVIDIVFNGELNSGRAFEKVAPVTFKVGETKTPAKKVTKASSKKSTVVEDVTPFVDSEVTPLISSESTEAANAEVSLVDKATKAKKPVARATAKKPVKAETAEVKAEAVKSETVKAEEPKVTKAKSTKTKATKSVTKETEAAAEEDQAEVTSPTPKVAAKTTKKATKKADSQVKEVKSEESAVAETEVATAKKKVVKTTKSKQAKETKATAIAKVAEEVAPKKATKRTSAKK